MSLEAALDEERLAVMELLEGRKNAARPARPSSPSAQRAQSPATAQSPLRSMLDVGSTPQAPAVPAMRSMLDIGGPPMPRTTGRGPSSPNPSLRSSGMRSPALNPETAYSFDMLARPEAHAMPKRNTLGEGMTLRRKKKDEKPQPTNSAYAQALGALGNPPSDRGRHNSTSGLVGKHQSKSPSSRLSGGRSRSPGGGLLNSNTSMMNDPRKFTSDSGKVIDMDTAFRRLSDANLVRSGGSLAALGSRKSSDSRPGSIPEEGERLEKDYDEEDNSSDVDDDSDASSGDDWSSEKGRGRRRSRGKLLPKDAADAVYKPPRSLLGAAEEERKEEAAKYKVRSLLEPSVTVTGPDGEKSKNRPGVHPLTSFDNGGGSGVSTPMDSDVEADMSEFKRAQKLNMSISQIMSTPSAHRCVRNIVRGDYHTFQVEAEQGLRRQRIYLVATDVSEEAAYALEWTIGTVLRDGDTLLAVYAVDEETGTGQESVPIGQGASAIQEANTLVRTMTTAQSPTSAGNSMSPPQDGASAPPNDRVPDLESMDKAERERWQATMEVSDRCVKLLRKTKLQVRVVVEVFHCKSPKHMLTEVIDYLEPTLVVLGSRGRSALKGVLLGSFSNYLVTKSSVPVMVARKRLRKHSKYKRTNLRLSNVLTNPTGKLAMAKID